MDSKFFEGISLLGRMSYGIMCAENYVLALYPDRNWKPLFERFWEVAGDVYWDEWAYDIVDIIPEYLFEFPDYESSGFEKLSEHDYNVFCELQKGLPQEWSTLLDRIRDMEEIYVYTSIPGVGTESITFLEEIVGILKGHNIEVPDPNLVAFSRFSEQDGRGDSFDCRKLSKIL